MRMTSVSIHLAAQPLHWASSQRGFGANSSLQNNGMPSRTWKNGMPSRTWKIEEARYISKAPQLLLSSFVVVTEKAEPVVTEEERKAQSIKLILHQNMEIFGDTRGLNTADLNFLARIKGVLDKNSLIDLQYSRGQLLFCLQSPKDNIRSTVTIDTLTYRSILNHLLGYLSKNGYKCPVGVIDAAGETQSMDLKDVIQMISLSASPRSSESRPPQQIEQGNNRYFMLKLLFNINSWVYKTCKAIIAAMHTSLKKSHLFVKEKATLISRPFVFAFNSLMKAFAKTS